MYEDLGRPDMYALFRWESDPAHISPVTLGQYVESQSDDAVQLGGESDPWARAKRVIRAFYLFAEIGDVVVAEFGLACTWADDRDRAHRILEALLRASVPD
jgi:hypothetical protein